MLAAAAMTSTAVCASSALASQDDSVRRSEANETGSLPAATARWQASTVSPVAATSWSLGPPLSSRNTRSSSVMANWRVWY